MPYLMLYLTEKSPRIRSLTCDFHMDQTGHPEQLTCLIRLPIGRGVVKSKGVFFTGVSSPMGIWLKSTGVM